MLGARVIVLKSPQENERGAILVDYNFAPPLFARFFDLREVAKHYFLVLEPGWSGYCTPEILCYTAVNCPVFVQAYEPRDAEFVRQINSNMIAVPLATNWWVDHRVMRPLPDVRKDVDIIMSATWGEYKRHEWFFAALHTEKAGIPREGSPARLSWRPHPKDVCRFAAYFGIQDQLEIYENIAPEQVNVHLNRSKVNILWSRREGVNRAIIEGMFAGVPCLVRDGFNYNYKYNYINTQTGCFSTERDLPDKLVWMIENYEQFDPRSWVLDRMTCQHSTAILNAAIRDVAVAAGERWSRDICVKTAGLNRLQYWNPEDRTKFEDDYVWLKSLLIKHETL